jgi:formylglycine-generating enzyme required for sulfatase activity
MIPKLWESMCSPRPSFAERPSVPTVYIARRDVLQSNAEELLAEGHAKAVLAHLHMRRPIRKIPLAQQGNHNHSLLPLGAAWRLSKAAQLRPKGSERVRYSWRFWLAHWVALMSVLLISAPSHAQSSPHERTFRDCPNCPEMVIIPPGSFLMGSSAADTKRDLATVPPIPRGFSIDRLLGLTQGQRARQFMQYEHPQHRVMIGKSFALSKYPITTAEFAAFVAATGYRTASCHVLIGNHISPTIFPAWQHPGFGVTGRDPVVCISWNDAQAYIRWLNSKVTGTLQRSNRYPYHLPFEAEWEYAARAGTVTSRWWGNGIAAANCNGCGREPEFPTYPSIMDGSPSPSLCCDKVQQGTTPIGSYPANQFGLYDMLGNVMEWTDDCWHPNYDGAPTDGGPWDHGDCSKRVVRGSGWNGDGAITWPIRSATRTGFGQIDASNQIGFRVAKTMP